MLPRQFSEQEKMNIVRRILTEKPDMLRLSKELDIGQAKLYAWKNQFQHKVRLQMRRKVNAEETIETTSIDANMAPVIDIFSLEQVESESFDHSKDRKKRLSTEEKIEAVQFLLDGESPDEIAEAFNVCVNSLFNWKKKYGEFVIKQRDKTKEDKPSAPIVAESLVIKDGEDNEEEVLEEDTPQPVVYGQPYYEKKGTILTPPKTKSSVIKPVVDSNIKEQLMLKDSLEKKNDHLNTLLESQSLVLKQQSADLDQLRSVIKELTTLKLRQEAHILELEEELKIASDRKLEQDQKILDLTEALTQARSTEKKTSSNEELLKEIVNLKSVIVKLTLERLDQK